MRPDGGRDGADKDRPTRPSRPRDPQPFRVGARCWRQLPWRPRAPPPPAPPSSRTRIGRGTAALPRRPSLLAPAPPPLPLCLRQPSRRGRGSDTWRLRTVRPWPRRAGFAHRSRRRSGTARRTVRRWRCVRPRRGSPCQRRCSTRSRSRHSAAGAARRRARGCSSIPTRTTDRRCAAGPRLATPHAAGSSPSIYVRCGCSPKAAAAAAEAEAEAEASLAGGRRRRCSRADGRPTARRSAAPLPTTRRCSMRSTTRSTSRRRCAPTRRSRCRCARLSDRVAAAPSAAWPGGAAASPPDGLVHPAVRRRCVQVLVAAAADRSQLLLKAEALAPRCGVSPHISPSLPHLSRPRCGIGAVEEHSRGRALRYSAALGCPAVFTQKHNHGPKTRKLRQSRKR